MGKGILGILGNGFDYSKSDSLTAYIDPYSGNADNVVNLKSRGALRNSHHFVCCMVLTADVAARDNARARPPQSGGNAHKNFYSIQCNSERNKDFEISSRSV